MASKSRITLTLTNSDIDIILSLLDDLRESGMYWGNREQFYKRRDTLITKIEKAVEESK